MGRKDFQEPYATKQDPHFVISSIGSCLDYAGDFFRRRELCQTLACVTKQKTAKQMLYASRCT